LGLLGKILEVDLTGEKWKFKEFPETVGQNYLGGRGLNVKHLYESIPPGTDPYGPDNILILSCGGLTCFFQTSHQCPVSFNRRFRRFQYRWWIWNQPAFMRHPAVGPSRSGIKTGISLD
jgi:hypothetical protein